jgi:hypothetical protein
MDFGPVDKPFGSTVKKASEKGVETVTFVCGALRMV